MMKAFLMIVLGLWASWHFTDLESASRLENMLAPLGVFFFLCALLVWLVLFAGLSGRTDSQAGSSSTGFVGGSDGGDRGSSGGCDSGGDGGGC